MQVVMLLHSISSLTTPLLNIKLKTAFGKLLKKYQRLKKCRAGKDFGFFLFFKKKKVDSVTRYILSYAYAKNRTTKTSQKFLVFVSIICIYMSANSRQEHCPNYAKQGHNWSHQYIHASVINFRAA